MVNILKKLICCGVMVGLLSGAGVATTGPVKGEEVLGYLDHLIDWYRRVEGAGSQGESSQEAIMREGVRGNARKVVELGFDFARAEAGMVESSGAATRPAAAVQKGKNLAQVTTTAEEDVARLQGDLVRTKAMATTRPALAVERDRLVAQLNLAQTRRDVLKQYSGFVTTAETGDVAEAMSKRINDLEGSVPGLKDEAVQQQGTSGKEGFRPESAGVFALVGRMFTLSGEMSTLNGLATETQRVRDECEKFRGPLRTQISQAVRQVDGVIAGGNAAEAGMDVQAINDLSERFKKLSAAGVPLGEQEVELDAAKQNLLNWRASLKREYEAVLKYLLIRVGAMLVVIILLVVGSELWKRATYRYVHDARRRRALMLVRRLVLAGVAIVIIAAGVMTEFGSLATFAGLITAGIAVALQTVILSGVAYFFFIGKFGVRVGDRVTISGITGDVIEIGLLRLYMSELAGKPADLHPTGRIVVFSNSVLFQPSAFYKQMPGANYVWHEVMFTLSPGTDVAMAEKRLVGAVEAVFANWEKEIDRGEVAGGLRLEDGELKPAGRLRLTDAGVELVVRYPVPVRNAAEEDDRVTRGLLTALEKEPKLKLAGGIIQSE